MANLRAFDLVAAEAGEMPVTRDGQKKAIFVKQFKDRRIEDNVRVVFDDGTTDWYYPDGRYSLNTDSETDLMLPAKSVELWLYLYMSDGTFYVCSHPSQELADRYCERHHIGPALRVEFPL